MQFFVTLYQGLQVFKYQLCTNTVAGGQCYCIVTHITSTNNVSSEAILIHSWHTVIRIRGDMWSNAPVGSGAGKVLEALEF